MGVNIAGSALLLLNSVAGAGLVIHGLQEQDAESNVLVMGTTGGARVVSGGQISAANFPDAALRYLGPGYKEVSPGRYVSADGTHQVRFGAHETKGPGLHGHFEAYDKSYFKGGKVIETTRVRIIR